MKNFNIEEVRKDFPALQEYVYLDTSSIALMPEPVKRAFNEFNDKINYAGTVSFDEEAEINSVEGARTALAEHFNCRTENIAIISSATEGLCQVAWGLQPKGKIIVVDMDHPTTVTPWTRIARYTGAEEYFIRTMDNPAGLTTKDVIDAIDENTSIVAVSHAQYSNGLVLDIASLAKACHEKGALCVVDASQSTGIVPIDLSKMEVDVLVTTGYKWLCGPFGAAGLYIRDTLMEKIEPTFVGWRTMRNPYHFDATRYEYNEGMRKYEYSTMSYSAGFALGEAVKYMNMLGIDNIRKQALKVANYLMKKLDEIGAEVLSPREEERRTGTVFARFPGLNGEEVAAKLNQAGVIVSPRFGGTRFACHYFNNEDDIDKAVEILKNIIVEMRQ